MIKKKQYNSVVAHWVARNRLFALVCGLGLITYLLISITKHLHFGSTGYDLVIFDQAVRNYSEFDAPASSFRGYDNLLGDHFHPILVLLAPLYWLFNSPISLLVAQAFLFVSAGLPIYLYSKKKLGEFPSLFIIIAFLLSPLILHAVNFDFHEIAFAVPLIAWIIYLIEERKLRWMYIPVILLLVVKEDLSFLIIFFGFYLLLMRQFRHGILFILGGLIWFFVVTKVFIPFFAGEGAIFNYWTYDQLGPDLPSAIIGAIKNPVFAISLLILPITKLLTLIKTFGLFLGFSFVSPLIILAVPLLLERLLSSNENYWQFGYHYGATLAPILVMASVDGINRVRHFFKNLNKESFAKISAILLASVALISFIFSPLPSVFSISNFQLTGYEKDGYKALSQIPPGESVCTTNHIAPHLGKHILTLVGFSELNPDDIHCSYIVISRLVDQTPELTKLINSLVPSRYTIFFQQGEWSVYRSVTAL